jgi:hypothetical protein
VSEYSIRFEFEFFRRGKDQQDAQCTVFFLNLFPLNYKENLSEINYKEKCILLVFLTYVYHDARFRECEEFEFILVPF